MSPDWGTAKDLPAYLWLIGSAVPCNEWASKRSDRAGARPILSASAVRLPEYNMSGHTDARTGSSCAAICGGRLLRGPDQLSGVVTPSRSVIGAPRATSRPR